MPALWIASTIVLWMLVLFETSLLLLLLRTLGKFQQQGLFRTSNVPEILGGLAVGEQAPAFSAVDVEGNEVRLDGHRGMQHIVAFVSPSCSACSETVEALNNVIESEPDIAIVAVGGLDREANRLYATEHKARMPILTPKSDVGRELYRVRGVPYVYVLDEEGIVRASGIVNGKEHLHTLLESSRQSVPATANEVPKK